MKRPEVRLWLAVLRSLLPPSRRPPRRYFSACGWPAGRPRAHQVRPSAGRRAA